MPREGWSMGRAPAGTEGMEAAGCIPQREESGTSTCIPGSDGATPGVPESQKGARCAQCLPWGTGHKALTVTTSSLHTTQTDSVAKGREIGARIWEFPFPQASSQCHQETTMYRKKGHTGVVAVIQKWESKINMCGKGQGGKELSNDGSGGPRASPAALR